VGLYDKSLVIVVADHGISFRHLDLSRKVVPGHAANVPAIAFPPLFVKYPDEHEGRIVDRHVETIDIVPTIADAVGVRIPWKVDGHSLLDPHFRRAHRYYESAGGLVRLPDELDFTTAASLGCRFVTSFRAIVDQGRTCAGQWVAVHGCGGVGLSAVHIASAVGANVVGVDISEEKLGLPGRSARSPRSTRTGSRAKIASCRRRAGAFSGTGLTRSASAPPA
jgi:hypothetical protein